MESTQKSSNIQNASKLEKELPTRPLDGHVPSSTDSSTLVKSNYILKGVLDPENYLNAPCYVSESCLDFLYIEMVQAVMRITRRNRSKERKEVARMLRGLSLSTHNLLTVSEDKTEAVNGDSDEDEDLNTAEDLKWINPIESVHSEGEKSKDSDEQLAIDRESAYLKIEQIGYRVGYSIAEKLSRDRNRFSDNLDVMKFICKEFWSFLFKKQIDNLKTNHRGVYVLQDNQFRWITRVAPVGTLPPNLILQIRPYLAFPCGLLRGAVQNLGINASVTAEATHSPQCTFKVEVIQPTSGGGR